MQKKKYVVERKTVDKWDGTEEERFFVVEIQTGQYSLSSYSTRAYAQEIVDKKNGKSS